MIKKTCDLCGREFEYPLYAYLWEKVICFQCAWETESDINLDDVVILPVGCNHYGQ